MLRQDSRPGEVQNELISVRLGRQEADVIDKLVSQGFFLNRSDFARTCIREKLSSTVVIQERKADLLTAKKEVLAYLKGHPYGYASDIALEARLDYALVVQAMKELQEEGRLADAE